MSNPIHRFGRSAAVAVVALLLIVGGAFANNALAPSKYVTGADPALSSRTDATTIEVDHQTADEDAGATGQDADKDDADGDDADEAETPEAPEIETPDLVEVKTPKPKQHEQTAKGDDQGENDDDQGENEHDGAEHGDVGGEGGD